MGKIDTKIRLSDMIDNYQNLIFTICYRMTGDYFAAQDLTQDTFLAAYRHLEEIDAEHEKGWLARTAHNRCIDHMRKAERSAVSVEPEKLFDAKEPKGTESYVLELDLREELKENCRKLKEPYSEVAYRYFYLEETPEEIAEELQEKPATVKTRIYRARDQLRAIYRERETSQNADGHKAGDGKEAGG
ncbi:MAG: sigma-70 family RNA polymerase sigma factor [Lachnospiraceae bacterium]|nr:sigma-70 family RNA polymerase sigma factor [Lachnospiraceae bacterium]MBQ8118653.1 sigma-70 family RNA polymerase sigma factor [Lachnospiraceae bacterium]